ncbi:Kinesin-like protein CG14535 [Camponotus japonicus]
MATGQEGKESPRAAQKLNLSSSPHRRRRSGDENIGSDELPIFPNGYAALLLKSPPPAPPALLRRIGVKELTGVGKVSPYRYCSLGGADDEVSVAILENSRS